MATEGIKGFNPEAKFVPKWGGGIEIIFPGIRGEPDTIQRITLDEAKQLQIYLTQAIQQSEAAQPE